MTLPMSARECFRSPLDLPEMPYDHLLRTAAERHPDRPAIISDMTQRSALQDLAFFVGKWQANGTFFATPTSPQKPIAMTTDVTFELGGHWLVQRTEEQPTPENPSPLSVIYIWGYDLTSQQFIASWFASNGGRATQTSSGWNGDQLVFLGEMTIAGQTFPLRSTFIKKGENTFYYLGEVYFNGKWIPRGENLSVRWGAIDVLG